MKHISALLLLLCCGAAVHAQAFFRSIANGNWNDIATWTLVSGSSTDNYPIAGDSVVITNANAVTIITASQCNALTITGGASLSINSSASQLNVGSSLNVNSTSALTVSNLGMLTVSGSMTIATASVLTINQGVVTVVGLVLINSPTASTGTTLLDIEAGIFSCAGGTTITATTIPANRFAELRIGTGAVNLVGGMATITANARINFTGNGTLTLAGVVSISNPNSFIAGNGRVVYFGIPGASQTVAPVTYNRLVITGVGSGIKEINGTVRVMDTLALLTDTLMVNGGGVLQLDNNVTVVRTAGKLASVPVYSGSVNIVYNNIVADTTGPEMPVATSVLHDLTISDVMGIKLGAVVTVNNTLHLVQGPLLADSFPLRIVNAAGGVTTDPAIQRTNGYVIGVIERAVGTSPGIRIFPFGVRSQGYYREFAIDYTTAPAVAGMLTVQHVNSDAPNQSGLPIADGAVTLTQASPMYWQADGLGGLSGGIYSLSLTGEGVQGIADISTLRIIKRPSAGGVWITDGVAGTNTGTNFIPVINRTGMSGFSQFTFAAPPGNILPITLTYFSGKVLGEDILLQWSTASETNNKYFVIEQSRTGNDFSNIGTQTAIGNSPVANSYSFVVQTPLPGIHYFRLKQVDVDGGHTYSKIIALNMNDHDRLKVFPAIAFSTVTITGYKKGAIRLYNAAGQFLRPLSAGLNDVHGLASGIYYIKAGTATVKFVRQ